MSPAAIGGLVLVLLILIVVLCVVARANYGRGTD